MTAELPIDALEKNYQVSSTMDGVTYAFVVRWNGRALSWYFDLLDANGDAIVSGVRIVLGALFGRRSVDPRFPPGRIFASDLSNTGREATRDDLGVRVKLYYTPSADL